MPPHISVYVTSYNQADCVCEAIDSVLAQTLRPLEIIIIDDCSTDGSQDLIAGYAERHPGVIKPVLKERNEGVAAARSTALDVVTGEYVTYVDGDDKLLPDKLEREVERLEQDDSARIVFSNYFIVDGDKRWLWADNEVPPEGNVFSHVFARHFPRHNLFRNEMTHVESWRRIGTYDSSLDLYEDYEMRIRLTKRLRAVYCDRPLAEYRHHEGGLSAQPLERHVPALEYIYRKNRGLLSDLPGAERRATDGAMRDYIALVAAKAATRLRRDGKGRAAALPCTRKAMEYASGPRRIAPMIRLLMPCAVGGEDS